MGLHIYSMWYGVRRLSVFVAVLAAVAAAIAILDSAPADVSLARVTLIATLVAIAAGTAAAGLIFFTAWVVEGFLIGLKKRPHAPSRNYNDTKLNEDKVTGEQPLDSQPRQAKGLSAWWRALYTTGAFFGALLLSFLVGTGLYVAGGEELAQTMFAVAWLVAIGAAVHQWKSTAPSKDNGGKSKERNSGIVD